MLEISAHAKLDLALSITSKKRIDGYLPVHYLDCQLTLCDHLSFEKIENKIEVICDNPEIGSIRENDVYRAACLLRSIFKREALGARIHLTKHIPIRAGFGGGSSDAAATIQGLCKLWDLSISDRHLDLLVHSLGKDFYFSFHGGISEVIGKGNQYQCRKIAATSIDCWLVILQPAIKKPSTTWMYQHLDFSTTGRHKSKPALLRKAIESGEYIAFYKHLHNDFEQTAIAHFPVIQDLRDALLDIGAKHAMLAGAGLSVVGFFENLTSALSAKEQLQALIEKPIILSQIHNELN